MEIPRDKLLHLGLGALLALLLVAVLEVARLAGPGWALALGSIALGLGVEGYQQLRGEGKWELRDAAATAAAGVLLGLAYEFWKLSGGSGAA